jgi:hypothetical protein
MAKKSVTATTYPEFKAALTVEQQQGIERLSVGFGVNRRIATSLMTRSRKQLIAGGDGTPPDEQFEALILIEQQISNYIDHLNDMQEMAKAAQARVFATMQTMIDLAEKATA